MDSAGALLSLWVKYHKHLDQLQVAEKKLQTSISEIAKMKMPINEPQKQKLIKSGKLEKLLNGYEKQKTEALQKLNTAFADLKKRKAKLLDLGNFFKQIKYTADAVKEAHKMLDDKTGLYSATYQKSLTQFIDHLE